MRGCILVVPVWAGDGVAELFEVVDHVLFGHVSPAFLVSVGECCPVGLYAPVDFGGVIACAAQVYFPYDGHLKLCADVVCGGAVVGTEGEVACSDHPDHEVVVVAQEVFDWFGCVPFCSRTPIAGHHEDVGLCRAGVRGEALCWGGEPARYRFGSACAG